ncbi:MAG: C10 family peptidase [Muribaculaceae bacterium]|nr:C10 family peptidase [Muribaculaceae bacterium]
MIKKLFTAIMILASIQAWGNPIDWNQAEMVATQFAQSNKSQAGNVQWNRVTRNGVISGNGDAPLYVFNRADGSGFVIVAGDDTAIPILGYSTEGSFNYNDMPSNLRQWLLLSERYVEACASRQGKAPEAQHGETIVAPLLGDILWGQGTPYNDMCPTYDGGTHYYVGCVATATTQIMRYHSYPEHGTGSKTITVNGQAVTADFGNTTYDWNNMLPTYEDVSYTSVQSTAVATLAAHFGVAVDMEYQPAGSGAHSMVVPHALREFFNYDQAVTMRKRDYYSTNEWLQLIKSELDQGRPVYYAASSETGSSGHAFVCDGYDSEDYVHINWGWYGTSNGYFLVSHLDPDDLGIGGGTGGYNLDQEIITGIQPPTSGTTYERPLYNSLSMRLITQDASTFNVLITVENFDTKPFTGELGVVLVRDNSIVKVLKAEQHNIAGFDGGHTGLLTMASIYDIPKQVGSGVPDGDATVWMAFREDSQSPWQLMRYCRGRDSRNKPYVGFFNTTVSNGRILTIDDSCEHPEVEILSHLEPEGEVYECGAALFNLRLRNNSPAVRLRNIVVRFTSTADENLTFDFENEVNVYDAVEETIPLLVNLDEALTSGEYQITVFEKGFEEYPFVLTQGGGIVNVLPQATTPVMRLTTAVQWRNANNEEVINQGDNIYFALNSRNYGSAGNVGVILNLEDVNDPTKRYIYQQSNATVETGEAKTFTFYRKLPVDPGTYRVVVSYVTEDGIVTDDINNDRYPLVITVGEASDIYLNAVAIDLPNYVVKGERLMGTVTLSAPSDHNGYVYVRMRQYTLTNGGILYMGNQNIPAGEERTINISSVIDFEPGRYLIMVEARHGSIYGTIGNYENCYKLIDVVTEPPVEPVAGDVDGDGFVTSTDVTALYNYLLSGDTSAIVNGDQNNDGAITSNDVTFVYNILLGTK